MAVLGFHVEPGLILVGALTGLAYGLLGIGLVLIYRATGVINFAHGEIGAFCAVVLAKLVLDLHWNFFLAFAGVVVLGVAVGAFWELTVIRRLFAAPRLTLLVATIGIAQVMLAAQLLLPRVTNLNIGQGYPSPIHTRVRLFGAVLGGGHFMLIAVVPVLVAALAYLLNRTSFGLAIRAAADNSDVARLAGISVRQVSTAVWAIAGALAAATFVLISPVRGALLGTSAVALGPGLLLRALAAGLVGRLTSFPQTLIGGVAVGIGEAVLFENVSRPGTVDAYVFIAVVLLVLFRVRGTARDDTGQWSLAPKISPVPAALRAVWWVRRLPLFGISIAVVGALVAPVVFSQPSDQFTLSRIVLFALAGISVVMITGWAGQLALAQFAFVGIGAVVTAGLSSRGMPFGFAVLYATVAGVVAAVLVGGPALRIRGLYLAVVTLAFAIGASGWVLPHSLFFRGSTSAFVARSRLGPLDFASQRTYYYLCLAVLTATLLAVSRLRRTGVGRCIVAVRENEQGAAALTVSPTVTKLGVFALSGGIAALAGALLAGLTVRFGANTFPPSASLQLVAMVIIGGLGSVTGAVLGAVYLVGIPAITGTWIGHVPLLGNSGVYVTLLGGVGLISLLMANPAGVLQGLYRARDALLRLAERRISLGGTASVSDTPRADDLSETEARRPRRLPLEFVPPSPSDSNDPAPLRIRELTVVFGGLVANNKISIEVGPGEMVGLIGTNGAGKSTLMDALSGFVPVKSGMVELFGEDVTALAAHERAALGVGRVFQNARLFGDLTVFETVAVALEARQRTELVPSLLALPPSFKAERRKRAEAAELIDFLGLAAYADVFNSELSTGTRRFVEFASLLAVGARLLLLDEPTAGVAQRESEAFGPLIKQVQDALGASVLIIEHDIPLVAAISNRLYCLSAGEVIAEGTPDQVRQDPKVIASYLGTDERAIRRSDAEAYHPGTAMWS